MNRIVYTLIFLLASTQAKSQWQIVDTIDNANFINIHFSDSSNGIISGQMQGRFLKTTDGGQSWDTIKVPFLDMTTDNLTDMQFVNKDIGFACGGSGFALIHSILMGTTDGGQTWDSLVVNLPAVYEFNGVDFKVINNKIKGLVFNFSFLFRTLDSGKTLLPVNKPFLGFSVHDATILYDSTIFIAGRNDALKVSEIHLSHDWGANWQLVHTDTSYITSLSMSGALGFAGCSRGWVLKTTNGGNTWTRAKVASNDMTFNKVKFGMNGYPYLLAFNFVTGSGYVFGSDNNGSSWKSVLIDSTTWLSDIAIPATKTAYTISNRRLYKTTNGGGLGLSVTDITGEKLHIKMYPNPANNFLHIEVPDGVHVKTVSVYNAEGKCISKLEHNLQKIDVSSLARSVYFIEINTDKGVSKKKLLVQ